MADRPNVIVFFTDQQRHDSTGVHGNPLGLTPHFDRIARHGTDVHHSFTCAPVCGPARACLQTGTYCSTNGTFRNGIGLTDDLPHLARCFNDAGYHTGYIGKWHLAGPEGKGHNDERGPVPKHRRGGYQSWLAAEALEMTSTDYQTRLFDDDDQPVDLPGYRVDALADAMIRHIHDRSTQHADQPFFLFTSFLEPHHQNHVDDYPPPDGYRAMYDGRFVPPDLAALPGHRFARSGDPQHLQLGGSAHAHLGGYWGMVKRLDEALGRVLDALKSLGILENTIVLFTSDHACHFKTRNGEYKRSCHESSIRVPTALTGGPFIGGGQVQELVNLVDLPPTLLDACGIDVPAEMEGRSLLPLLRGGRDPQWPDDAYIQVCDAEFGRAIRTKRWKYCVMADPEARKAATFDTYHEMFLYDLKYDPYELTNLIHLDSHSRVRAVMRDRLKTWFKRLGEPEATIVEAEITGSGGQRVVTEEEARN